MAVDMYMATETPLQSLRLSGIDWELLESIEGILEASLLSTLSHFSITLT